MNKFQAKKYAKSSKIPRNSESFFFWAKALLKNLPERSAQIVSLRFGLDEGRQNTLEDIGREYGVTRERIRQIISHSIKNISAEKNSPHFQKAKEKILFTIHRNNGIIKKSDVAKVFRVENEKEANAVFFFSQCLEEILEREEKGFLERSWVVSDKALDSAKKVISRAEEVLRKEKRVFSDEEIFSRMVQDFSNLGKKQLADFLAVSSRVKKNRFGKWGLSNWIEINPRGTRERIFLILRETKKPMHFMDIARAIDRYGLSKRKAHPQTVHNELIKDDRFILIGRGIYALSEWGYFEGTTREVLERILRQSRKPLKKEEILKEVLKIRKVKKTTVMINLNNRQVFEKQGDRYGLKK